MTALHLWLIALGAGLAVGPVVLHLLMQEKPKRMVFPALRFVLQKQFVARRSMRLRHWLLLLFRIGLIALVALALSRPAAATAIFGSYLLLGVTIVSGLFFAFVTLFWKNKSGQTEGAISSSSSNVSSVKVRNAASTKNRKMLKSSWPVALLSLIVLGHVFAAGYLGWQLIGKDDVPILSGKQPVSAAIVIDTSPRMNYRFNNQSRLERAKELADSIVKKLPAGSQLAVIDSGPEAPGLSLDIAAAGQQIDSLEVTYQSQPLPARAKAALDLLAESPLENKELYLISDLTRPSWDTAGRRIDLSLTDDDEAMTYLIDVGMKSYDNWTISDWATPTPSITPGGTFKITCTVTRNAVDGSGQDLVSEVAADQLKTDVEQSTEPEPLGVQNSMIAKPATAEPETRTVRLMIEKPQQGRPVYRNGKTLTPDEYWERFTQVTLSPGQSIEVGFQVSNLPKGEHHAWVEVVGGDALPFDNQRYVTIRVEDAWKALVVTGPEVKNANLVEAISPTELRELGQTSFDCKTINAPEMEILLLSDYRVVFLLNPAPLSENQWNQLRRYVNNGGSVAIFLGHNALTPLSERAVVDSAFLTETARELLPGQLEDPWRSPRGEFMLDPIAWDHPIFSKMKNLRTQMVWSRLPVFMHYGMNLQRDEVAEDSVEEQAELEAPGSSRVKQIGTEEEVLRAVRVLATFNNNMPAIIETTYGQGQVITMTTPISDPTRPEGRLPWNSFAVGNDWSFMYFLLINEISRYLATSQAAALNGNIGDSFFIASDDINSPSNYALFRPDDLEPLDIQVEKGRLFVDFTNHPGSYRLSGLSAKKQIILKGFSVNTTGSVSELTRVGKSQLDSILGKGKYLVAENEDQIVRSQGQGRVGLEFYPSLIRLLAILFVCELLFSNFFYRSPPTATSPV